MNSKFLLTAFCAATLSLGFTACDDDDDDEPVEQPAFAEASMWAVRPTLTSADVDVFYIVSTVVTYSRNDDGTPSYTALLSEEDKECMDEEINHVHEEIFPEGVNFYSPYYHMMTMEAYVTPGVDLVTLATGAKQELCAAFDYYMENLNNGRPFIIAGYSQGSIMVKTLLQHMTDEQYSRMVAAYMMGFGLDAETLENAHVKAAEKADDTGVTITWNSVSDTDAIYSSIWNNATTCINPITWTTDDAIVDYDYDGEHLQLHVDQDKHVLIVEGFHLENHPSLPVYDTPWPEGCYHDYEIYLYNPSIRQNILCRIEAFNKKD